MRSVAGIGVLDKAMAVLDAVAQARRLDLAGLVSTTGLTRATAHRLARGLEAHGLLERDASGAFVVGLRVVELAGAAGAGRDLRGAARPVMEGLAAATGESVQLFVREGDARVCIEAVDSARGLRDIVPVGARLPLTAGSGAKVLRAWVGEATGELDGVRRKGWAESVAEREPGVASVSAPVRDGTGRVVAALSVSGPIERLTRRPGRRHAAAVVDAAAAISGRLGSSG